MLKRKAILIFCIVFILLISAVSQIVFGNNLITSNSPINNEKSYNEKASNAGYTHTVLVEVATSQTCGPCHYMSRNLYNLYTSGDYDFEFMEMILYDDKNKILNYLVQKWVNSYNIWKFPTVIFDGDYQRLEGNYGDQVPIKLDDCGTRSVSDLVANLDVLWLGNATMQVDASIQNNEQVEFNGYIKAGVTEIISRYDTFHGEPYHFGFVSYAIDKPISLAPGETYTSSEIWIGDFTYDSHGSYYDIAKDNIRVIMAVYKDGDDYVEATVATNPVGDNFPPNEPKQPSPPNGADDVDINADLSWYCREPDGEPLTYDVYFGTNSNPPKVSSKQSETLFDLSTLEKETTYYWKIVAYDPYGASTPGPIWSFTTKEKESSAPKVEITKPIDALYINDKKIISKLFLLPLIIGDITIEANAIVGDSEIEKVEFYINDKLKETDSTEPYSYEWKQDRPRLFHLYLIKVIAYSIDGNIDTKQILVRKFL